MAKPRTLFDKIWQSHLVDVQADGTCLIYIDRHLVHEVTSPQAFEGLRQNGRKVRRPEMTLAVADHNIPTTDRSKGIEDEESRIQVETLESNVKAFGVPYFPVMDARQGIVHIIGPEQGFTLPGMTIVCGDSHTATHGAFGSLAFGIGTSEVEHVLATQTLVQAPAKNMRITVDGELPAGVTSKDVILAIIGAIGTAGQSCGIRGFRAGEATAVAPFDYFRLLFAGLFGYLLFGDVPTPQTLMGAGLIVASTLYIARREAVLARLPAPSPATKEPAAE